MAKWLYLRLDESWGSGQRASGMALSTRSIRLLSESLDRRPGYVADGVLSMLEQREGGCHCGRVRFRARVDLDLLSQCNCSICTKQGILHLPIAPEDFELLRGKTALTVYTFETGWRSTRFVRIAACMRSTFRARSRTGLPSTR